MQVSIEPGLPPNNSHPTAAARDTLYPTARASRVLCTPEPLKLADVRGLLREKLFAHEIVLRYVCQLALSRLVSLSVSLPYPSPAKTATKKCGHFDTHTSLPHSL